MFDRLSILGLVVASLAFRAQAQVDSSEIIEIVLCDFEIGDVYTESPLDSVELILSSQESDSSFLERLTLCDPMGLEGPYYPSCEDSTSVKARQTCTGEMILQFFKNEFAYGDQITPSMGRFWISITVDKDGSMRSVDIHRSTYSEEFNAEAIRVLRALPKFTPTEKEECRIPIAYHLPIDWKVFE